MGYTQSFSQAMSKLNPCPVDLVSVRDMTSQPVERAAKHLRMVKVLAEALANIAKEIEMFTNVLTKHGLAPDIDGRSTDSYPQVEGRGRQAQAMAPSQLLGSWAGVVLIKRADAVTQAYLDFMIATTASRSIEESIILLWATERVSSPFPHHSYIS